VADGWLHGYYALPDAHTAPAGRRKDRNISGVTALLIKSFGVDVSFVRVRLATFLTGSRI
jgi:hypothetical protein